jgi:membrane-associated protease RseP (regulator of RpoE activity)
MDIQTVLAIIFILGMALFLWINRRNVVFQKILGPIIYFAMYRGNWGLHSMDRMAKRFPRFMRGLFTVGIWVGFLGMLVIGYMIIDSSILLFTQPTAAPGIQPVLPFQAKGVFFVPFAYWIISIFLIAAIHEYFHGVAARAYNIPVRSSGFAFLGIIAPVIPAAFVEPDEHKLVKRPVKEQLAVFAAGPFANVLLALVIIFAFGFSFPGVPASVSHSIAIVDLPQVRAGLTQWDGLRIVSVTPNTPAAAANLASGNIITKFDGIPVSNEQDLTTRFNALGPGQHIVMTVDNRQVELNVASQPDDNTKPLIGISFEPIEGATPVAKAKYGDVGIALLSSLVTLLVFIYALSLGIGLFNLLPLGPVDGGRMFKLASERFFGAFNGVKAWKYVSFFFLGLIVINLVVGFVR